MKLAQTVAFITLSVLNYVDSVFYVWNGYKEHTHQKRPQLKSVAYT